MGCTWPKETHTSDIVQAGRTVVAPFIGTLIQSRRMVVRRSQWRSPCGCVDLLIPETSAEGCGHIEKNVA
jgi:hypothetical protein